MAKVSITIVRRASGRLLRAHRKNIIKIKGMGECDCVEALTHGFVPPHVRANVMKVWSAYGADILRSNVEEGVTRHKLDDSLDAIVADK